MLLEIDKAFIGTPFLSDGWEMFFTDGYIILVRCVFLKNSSLPPAMDIILFIRRSVLS